MTSSLLYQPKNHCISPLKTTQLSARVQNHASPERCCKSFTIIFYHPASFCRRVSCQVADITSHVKHTTTTTTIIFLGDHDFPLTGSNFGYLTAFTAIFSHIFTAHAQEPAFMNFQWKFWHHHLIPWSRFPYRARYFRDTRTFSVDFCIG